MSLTYYSRKRYDAETLKSFNNSLIKSDKRALASDFCYVGRKLAHNQFRSVELGNHHGRVALTFRGDWDIEGFNGDALQTILSAYELMLNDEFVFENNVRCFDKLGRMQTIPMSQWE